MMNFFQKNPAVLVAIIVIALGIAGWSIWRMAAPPAGDPTETKMGPITPMSSMFGPDQSGAPRPPPPPGMPGPGTTGPSGSAPNGPAGAGNAPAPGTTGPSGNAPDGP